MEITVSAQDGIAVVAPSGVIDTRGSLAFEAGLMDIEWRPSARSASSTQQYY